MTLQEVWEMGDIENEIIPSWKTAINHLYDIENKTPQYNLDYMLKALYDLIYRTTATLRRCDVNYSESHTNDCIEDLISTLNEHILDLHKEFTTWMLIYRDDSFAKSHEQIKYNPLDNDNDLENLPIARDDVYYDTANIAYRVCDLIAKNGVSIRRVYRSIKRLVICLYKSD
jgi:hypothetical protein